MNATQNTHGDYIFSINPTTDDPWNYKIDHNGDTTHAPSSVSVGFMVLRQAPTSTPSTTGRTPTDEDYGTLLRRFHLHGQPHQHNGYSGAANSKRSHWIANKHTTSGDLPTVTSMCPYSADAYEQSSFSPEGRSILRTSARKGSEHLVLLDIVI